MVRDEHDAAIAAAYTPVNKPHVLPPAVESQAAGSGSILHRIWSGVESKFNSVVGVSVGTAQQQVSGGVLLFAADVGDDAWDYLIHDQVAKAGVDFPELDLHGRLAKLLNQAGIRTDTLYSVIGEYGPLFIPGPEGAERAAGAANDALRALEETVGRGSRVATKESGELGTRLAAANTGTRLAQDIAVNPAAPRALPLNRPVGGSASQNAFVQDRIAGLQSRGATDFRVNQQQVNINGVRVGVNRPDLQYTLNGQRFYEEFDIPSSNRGPLHEARILTNDPSGFVNLFTVP